jgi:tRNA threonylcarbamoyl adenosine modification protein YeaZ
MSGPVLALEASSLRPSAALLDGAGDLLGSWAQLAGVRGTAALGAGVGELLDRHGLAVGDLLGVVVGLGPGSYTGLRAAAALGRALVLPDGLPLAGVPSVAAAARSVLVAEPDVERIVVLLDARRDQLYRADYVRQSDGSLATTMEPCLVAVDDPLPDPGPSVRIVREPVPEAYDVAVLGRARLMDGGDDPASVRPLYLKRSHAEIAWEESRRRSSPP